MNPRERVSRSVTEKSSRVTEREELKSKTNSFEYFATVLKKIRKKKM
jgi:hypothetical protein